MIFKKSESLLVLNPESVAVFTGIRNLADHEAFTQYLEPLKQTDWYVYAKKPFAGPEAVLAYLSRYTHRVAISKHRLVSHTDSKVTFKCKDYRGKGRVRHKSMTVSTDEFIRRFLIHVLPRGFHRIRHYGLLASPVRNKNLVRLRLALDTYQIPEVKPADDESSVSAPTFVCRACGKPLLIIETLSPMTRAPP